MFVIFGILVGVAVVSGAAGAALAIGRARNPYAWFVVCALLPLIGQIALLATSRGTREDAGKTRRKRLSKPDSEMGAQQTATANATHALLAADPFAGLPPISAQQRWAYLVEYDPLLRDAARVLQPFGPEAVDELRDAHFALQDRSLVPAIVERIRDRWQPMEAPALMPAPQAAPLSSLVPRSGAASAGLATDLDTIRQFLGAAPASAAIAVNEARPVPSHTTVTAEDLDTAAYAETYRGVHLYRLADGRVYVDGELALASLDAARRLIDMGQGTSQIATGTPQPAAMTG